MAPTDLASALDILRDSPCRVIAGGTDVYPAMQQGKTPDAFLDVTRIAELTTIEHTANGTRIGAAVTWSELVRADLPPAFDGLKTAALEVGSLQIQNAGTLAGNLCNASPAADGVPALLTLDCDVELASAQGGVRRLALADFILGVRKTALAADEIVTALHIPAQPDGATSSFAKLGSRRYLVISITMTGVVLALDADGRITHARVAVGACSPVAQRLPALERDMLGQRPEAVDIRTEHLTPLSPIDDVRGSGAYRLDAVQTQCLRAIHQAAQKAGGA